MKVAIISRGTPNKQYPLYGIFEFDQAKALAKKGIEVAFVAIDFRSHTFKRKYGLMHYEKDGVQVFELSLPINVYRKAIPLLQRLLLIPFRTMLKSFGKPDVIHAHFYSIAAITSILKKKYGIPFVVTEHSSKLNKPAEQISDLDKRLALKAYQSCDQLICVSEALGKNILQNFRHNCIVIPNMVDNGVFRCHKDPLDKTPFVYVSVGNLIPIKAFDVLLEAFAQVKENAKLYIIGDGSEKERLKNLANALQLGNSVEFLGQLKRTEISTMYQKSHVFVLPSRSETFGVSYIEALYAGLPVIATRCGGPESFIDKSNGILIPVNNSVELSNAMDNIRYNYPQYDPKQISSDCNKRFSPSVIANELINLYLSIQIKN